jgi:hypothetical protein
LNNPCVFEDFQVLGDSRLSQRHQLDEFATDTSGPFKEQPYQFYACRVSDGPSQLCQRFIAGGNVRHRDCAVLFARLAGLVLVFHKNLFFSLSLINDELARGHTPNMHSYLNYSGVVL